MRNAARRKLYGTPAVISDALVLFCLRVVAWLLEGANDAWMASVWRSEYLFDGPPEKEYREYLLDLRYRARRDEIERDQVFVEGEPARGLSFLYRNRPSLVSDHHSRKPVSRPRRSPPVARNVRRARARRRRQATDVRRATNGIASGPGDPPPPPRDADAGSSSPGGRS